jgi:hypothetical protein
MCMEARTYKKEDNHVSVNVSCVGHVYVCERERGGEELLAMSSRVKSQKF